MQDAIVIGSGIGGMTAAGLLAGVANKSVLVLEKHTKPCPLSNCWIALLCSRTELSTPGPKTSLARPIVTSRSPLLCIALNLSASCLRSKPLRLQGSSEVFSSNEPVAPIASTLSSMTRSPPAERLASAILRYTSGSDVDHLS